MISLYGSVEKGKEAFEVFNEIASSSPHSGHAPLSHTHTEQDIVDLDKYTKSEIDSLLAEKADADHTHPEYYSPEQPINCVHLKAVDEEPIPNASNKYKLYVVKTANSIKLKMIVPINADETEFARALIWEYVFSDPEQQDKIEYVE